MEAEKCLGLESKGSPWKFYYHQFLAKITVSAFYLLMPITTSLEVIVLEASRFTELSTTSEGVTMVSVGTTSE